MRVLFLWIFFGLAMNVANAATMPTPFWEKDAKLKQKLQSDRAILVSVKSTKSDQSNTLTLQGVGRISAPASYVKEWVAHYDHLRRVSEYVKEVKWDADQQLLFLHTAAFDYHARMNISVKPHEIPDGRVFVLKIISGVFTGLEGELRVVSAGFQDSEVSLQAIHSYKTWNLPKIFLEFGLEVVLEKFSQRLKSLIEDDFKTGKWNPDPKKS